MLDHEASTQTDSYAVDTAMFEQLFSDGALGENYDRAMATYQNYGSNLSQPVLVALLHARDKGLVGTVLDQLEAYDKKTLHYQHPALRGMTTHILNGVNPTEIFFQSVFEGTLGLLPTPPEAA